YSDGNITVIKPLMRTLRTHLSCLQSLDYAMNYWKSNGAPAEKLLVGFPTYGHNFILQNPSNTALGAPTSGPGPAGPYTKEAGLLAYYEVCVASTSRYGGDVAVLITLQEPFCNSSSWTNWDFSPHTTQADWLKKNNYAGAMVWTIDLDDFTGSFCKQGKYPLITTLKNALGLQSSSASQGFLAFPAGQSIRGEESRKRGQGRAEQAVPQGITHRKGAVTQPGARLSKAFVQSLC
uniref:GH18 domain-containing protein n=1 Tax=Anas platyrhynchos TaxID=8839 RepID=A0A8B9ZJY0_ANAPL